MGKTTGAGSDADEVAAQPVSLAGFEARHSLH